MNRTELEQRLPHRGEMLLLDELTVQKDGTAAARFKIRENAWFLQGHFPDRPIVPGVILCECMAQACCALPVSETTGIPYLARIEKAVFRQPVVPGETLLLRCRLTRRLAPFYTAQCEAWVEHRLCAQATLQLTWRSQSGSKADGLENHENSEQDGGILNL